MPSVSEELRVGMLQTLAVVRPMPRLRERCFKKLIFKFFLRIAGGASLNQGGGKEKTADFACGADLVHTSVTVCAP
jgi:hypothetical protein